MHISKDFIATKTRPSYEFLVVFGQVRVWDRKSVGRVLARSVWVRGGSGQDFSNTCGFGAGEDKKFQPAQDSSSDVKRTKL